MAQRWLMPSWGWEVRFGATANRQVGIGRRRLAFFFLLYLVLSPNLALAAEQQLQPGTNLFSAAGQLPAEATTCFGLLQFLGGVNVVERIEGVEPNSGVVLSCRLDSGSATGDDFAIVDGRAYFVRMLAAANIELNAPSFCPDVLLSAGVNLIGVPGASTGLTCFGVLGAIGPQASSIEQLDASSEQFGACHFSTEQLPTGVNFTIAPGSGYVVNMSTGVPLLNLNALSDIAKCAIPPPLLTGFSPASAPVGTIISVTGDNLMPRAGTYPRLELVRQGGGTVSAPVASFSNTGLTFTVPTDAATGLLTIGVNDQQINSASMLEIVPSATFTLSAVPAAAALIQGEDVSFAITLNSNGLPFKQLAKLSLDGLPPGASFQFRPEQVTDGQTSILTVTAGAAQALNTSVLSISGAALVEGSAVSDSIAVSVNVEPVTTTFRGRVVIADPLQNPLPGVEITFLGKDDQGNATGCPNITVVSDAAGNFSLSDLPPQCTGPQLIRYNGLSATGGQYAGVDLFYNIAPDVVTESPVLVHLPRIDNVETVCVPQPLQQDLTFTFETIPNLSVEVYAGTVFTLPPNMPAHDCGTDFPLIAVQVPVDRLPEEMPPEETDISAFIVAFQPANAMASQPVAVSFPNLLDTPAGSSVELTTLDPTLGRMMVYGTGTVSSDGTEIVPDFDPANPGKRFGLVHFDWHGPVVPPTPPPDVSPCPQGCRCPAVGNPISVATGLKVERAIDLVLSGGRGSVQLLRTYRTLSEEAGPFGIGAFHNFSTRLSSNALAAVDVVSLVMPDGERIAFARTGPTTFANGTIPGVRGAVLRVDALGNSVLRYRDGGELHFEASTPALGSLLVATVDRNGNRNSVTRDAANPIQISSVSDPVGRRLRFTYDGNNRITGVSDPINRTVTYTYNGFGALETVTNAEGGITQYEYEAATRMSRKTDPRDIVVMQNVFDANGRVIEQTQADGGVIRLEYQLFNVNPAAGDGPVAITTVTDAQGHATVYRFSPQRILLDVTDASGQSRSFDYEPGSNLLLGISGNGSCAVCGDPSSGDVAFTYDADGNMLSRTDATGTQHFTYDPEFGQLLTATDQLDHATSASYDNRGNRLTQTDENGNTTTMTYNNFGQLVNQTDALLETTEFEYDPSGNAVATIDALGYVTRQRYDAVSRLVETEDALGRRSQITYDAMDRVVSTTDPLGRIVVTDYDLAGNRTSVTDPRGNSITFAFNNMARLTTRTDSRGAFDVRDYDFNGNVVSFIDRRGLTSTLSYDSMNRPITEAHSDAILFHFYDSAGRLVYLGGGDGGSVAFGYDAGGRVINTAGPNGWISYQRDAPGRLVTKEIAGLQSFNYSYDAVGNLLGVNGNGVGIQRRYDSRNQVESEERTNGVDTTYARDPLGRIVGIIHSSPSGAFDTQQYVYDAVGNRIVVTGDSMGPLITEPAVFTYELNSNVLVSKNQTVYTHDANGNRLTEAGNGNVLEYGWDGRNRLASLSGPVESREFRYDHQGGLVEVRHNDGANTESTLFLLDDQTNIAARIDPGNRVSAYLTGLRIDSHFASVNVDDGANYLLTDALNSVVTTVDESGAIVGGTSYDPFGVSNGAEPLALTYTGRLQVTDELLNYRARYFSPATARFLSEDPIGFDGGDANVYRYVGNNPMGYIDPRGLRRQGGGSCLDDCDRHCDILSLPFGQAGRAIGTACRRVCKQQPKCRAEECGIYVKRVTRNTITFCQQCPGNSKEICDVLNYGL